MLQRMALKGILGEMGGSENATKKQSIKETLVNLEKSVMVIQ
jgi:hypothetical protein